jgi:hypothetical protein
MASADVRIVKIDDLSPDIAEEGWSLYWAETKSTSEYFREFLLDPLTVLTNEIPEVDRSWHLITNVINHHVPLKQNLVCRVSMVMPEDKTVLNILYKHREAG